ncbi:MAG: VOC family protein [Candidatus Eremiobacteraeota bacterium]|nr:VOC family protein [Candidatus Eremiobacteraeota bacterium]
MKMHLNLTTRDVDRAVAFYSTLLDARPVKHFGDYALFVTEEPGLELALDLDAAARAADGEHFGIVVESTDAVDGQIARLRAAGYPIEEEREETCCYAVQTKVWATDPDGRRWETYMVHAESEVRDDCCDGSAEPEPPGARAGEGGGREKRAAMTVLRSATLATGLVAVLCALVVGGSHAATTPRITADDPVSAGRYLVNYGGCNDCHTAGILQGQPMPAESQRLLGSQIGFMGPWGVSYPPNLRLALSTMTPAQYLALIKDPGPLGKPPMPWQALQSLSQADQLAIYAYIRSLGSGGSATPSDVPPGQKPSTPYIVFTPQTPAP